MKRLCSPLVLVSLLFSGCSVTPAPSLSAARSSPAPTPLAPGPTSVPPAASARPSSPTPAATLLPDGWRSGSSSSGSATTLAVSAQINLRALRDPSAEALAEPDPAASLDHLRLSLEQLQGGTFVPVPNAARVVPADAIEARQRFDGLKPGVTYRLIAKAWADPAERIPLDTGELAECSLTFGPLVGHTDQTQMLELPLLLSAENLPPRQGPLHVTNGSVEDAGDPERF